MNKFRAAWLLTCCVYLLAACGGGSNNNSGPPSLAGSAAFVISGSVGDGPITAADVSLIDADNQTLASVTSDSSANYELQVDSGIALPATIRVQGGTDLVTNRAADFELISLLLSEGDQTLNVTPVTTVLAKAAICADDLSATSIESLWGTLNSRWDVGVSSNIGNPVADPVDIANAETIVLTNEALGEVIRRATTALLATGRDAEEVVEVLACDLADGSLDGQVAKSVGSDDLRVLGVIIAAELSVRLEVLAGRLQVDGDDATDAMNSAIRTVLPDFTDADVNRLNIAQNGIDNAVDVATVLLGINNEAEFTSLLRNLVEATPTNVRNGIDQNYSVAASDAINDLAERIALADDTEIQQLNSRTTAQKNAPPPTLSIAADPSTVNSGDTTSLSWSSTNADYCYASGTWSGDQAVSGGFQSDAVVTNRQYNLTCVGLGGVTTSSAAVELTGNPGPTNINRVALAGCSQTRDWVGDGTPTGFEDITGTDLFTRATIFGGGSVDRWITPSNLYVDAFMADTQGDEELILAQICIRRSDPVSYEQVVEFIDLLKAEIPGKPIYIMPLDVSGESSPGCSGLSDYEASEQYFSRAIAEGVALRGPVIDPLYSAEETSDGCHPNDIGAARMTDTVRAWLQTIDGS